MKKLFAFGALALAACLLVGCAKTDNQEANLGADVVTYLQGKYGGDFAWEEEAPNAVYVGDTTRVSFARTPGIDTPILVEVDDYCGPDEEFRDNYLALRYEHMVTEFLHSCGDSLLPGNMVYYTPRQKGLTLPANTSFEDFLKQTDATLFFTICAKESSVQDKEDMERVGVAIAEDCWNFQMFIVVIPDDVFDSVRELSLSEQAEKVEALITDKDFSYCLGLSKYGVDGVVATWY